jgi:hypothetical protein
MSLTTFHENALRDPRVRAFLDTIARSEGAKYNTNECSTEVYN